MHAYIGIYKIVAHSLFSISKSFCEKTVLSLLDNLSKELCSLCTVSGPLLLSYHKGCHPDLGKPPTLVCVCLVIDLKVPRVRSNQSSMPFTAEDFVGFTLLSYYKTVLSVGEIRKE